MELRHLQYFVTVAEELHFGHAAERLHISQPPLSQQIRQLEDELRVQLFYRTKRHVELTEAGQLFLHEARLTLKQAERAVQIARQARCGEIGHLIIGFVGSAVSKLLPDIIRKYRKDYPDVELHLRELTTSQQVRAINDGRIHAGILRPPVRDHTLMTQILLKEPLILALSEDHQLAGQAILSLTKMADEHFILFPRSQGVGLYDQIIGLCQHSGFSPQVVQEATQMQTILGLVASGLGVALIPASAKHLYNEGIVYRNLQEDLVYSELALTWSKENESPVLQAFLKTVMPLKWEHK